MRKAQILNLFRAVAIPAVVVVTAVLPMGCGENAPVAKEAAKEPPGIADANKNMMDAMQNASKAKAAK